MSIIDEVINKLRQWETDNPESLLAADYSYDYEENVQELNISDHVDNLVKALEEEVNDDAELYSHCKNMGKYNELISHLSSDDYEYKEDYCSNGDREISIEISTGKYSDKVYTFKYYFNLENGTFKAINLKYRELWCRRPDNWEKDLEGSDMDAYDILAQIDSYRS